MLPCLFIGTRMQNEHVYKYFRWCAFVAHKITFKQMRATFCYQWADDERDAQKRFSAQCQKKNS